MATLGDYLIKVGDSKLPNKYISRGTYKAAADKIIAGEFVDANGTTHVEVLPNRTLNVELTISACPAALYEDIINLITGAFINANEENLLVTAWVPKLQDYVAQECLFEDDSPAVNAIVDGKLIYEKVKIKFKGKGGAIT